MSGHVPIYVPEPHHREMLEHLVSLMTGARAKSPIPSQSEEAAAAESDQWTDDVWEVVWPAVTPDARKVLVVLAENHDEWVPIAALEESLGSLGAVQGSISSIRKRMKKYEQREWPFEIAPDDRANGRFMYRIDEEMASIVLRLEAGG